MVIVESAGRKELYLDEAQLKTAQILYSTAAEDVYVSLEVLGANQEIWSESLRWVNGGATPSVPRPPELEAGPTPDENALTLPQHTRVIAAAVQSGRHGSTGFTPPPIPAAETKVTPKEFNPPLQRREPAPAMSAELPPPAVDSITAPPMPAGIPNPLQVQLPPRPLPAVEAVQGAAEGPQPAPVSASPPTPIVRPLPVWPRELTALLRRPVEIVVRAETDATGKVARVIPAGQTSGASQLTAIVVSTVRLWRFTPAKLNGQSVSGSTEIRFLVSPSPAGH